MIKELNIEQGLTIFDLGSIINSTNHCILRKIIVYLTI